MTTIEDWSIVDQIAHEPSPAKEQHAIEVRRAVARVARMTGGIVTAASVRDETPAWVNPHTRGAVFSDLVKHRVLVPTGDVAKSGNVKSRNRHRQTPVYRLVGEVSR